VFFVRLLHFVELALGESLELGDALRVLRILRIEVPRVPSLELRLQRDPHFLVGRSSDAKSAAADSTRRRSIELLGIEIGTHDFSPDFLPLPAAMIDDWSYRRIEKTPDREAGLGLIQK